MDIVEIAVCNGVEGPSVYINDYRVAGNKPWGGGKTIHSFKAEKSNIFHALKIEQILKEKDDEIERLRLAKDSAYLERNKLVAMLANVFPSGIKKTAIQGWDECWHGCVYIDFPWGQASWHYHDDHAYLFEGLRQYHGEWDGHTTDTKYDAIIKAIRKMNNVQDN